MLKSNPNSLANSKETTIKDTQKSIGVCLSYLIDPCHKGMSKNGNLIMPPNLHLGSKEAYSWLIMTIENGSSLASYLTSARTQT